jgi:hypothetical protein
MRRLPLLPVALLAGAVAVSGQAPPRLLVLVVVDQLRADYLTRFDAHWRAGFRTLLDEGAVFENTAYPYLNTVTCAGHATIGTGTFPSTHGMTGNAWWDRDHERSVACTADPDARTIVLAPPEVQEAASPSSDTSGSADEAPWGDSAWRLMVPTLADELRAQRPGARVVSLSLKARSAIGMAGHGGDAVLWFDADARSFVTSSAYAKVRIKTGSQKISRVGKSRRGGSRTALHEFLSPDKTGFIDRDAEQSPPDPVEGKLRDKSLDPLSIAPQLVLARDQRAVHCQGHTGGADRFVFSRSIWTGYAGHTDANVGSQPFTHASRHFANDLFTHRTV